MEKIVLSHDAVYVGGGNTLRLMTIWRSNGIDKIMKKAFKQGVVLAGISAGSICWFSYGNSDSRRFTSNSSKLIRVQGVGLIDAVHCPHYDIESHRQKDLKQLMQRTHKIPAITLDDCAALEVVDDKYRILISKPGAQAHKTHWKNGEYIIEDLAISQEWADLAPLLVK